MTGSDKTLKWEIRKENVPRRISNWERKERKEKKQQLKWTEQNWFQIKSNKTILNGNENKFFILKASATEQKKNAFPDDRFNSIDL